MWTFDNFHKIGEVVAAIAVVISLLFVDYEIKKSNEAQLESNIRAVGGTGWRVARFLAKICAENERLRLRKV